MNLSLRKSTITAVIIWLASVVNGHGQQNDQKVLLKQSKDNETLGWFLLGTGSVMATGGIIGISQQEWSDPNNTPSLIATTGLLTALSSIPFFVRSSRLSRRAAGHTRLQMRLDCTGYPRIGLSLRW